MIKHRWIINGYPYAFKASVPKVTDNSYPVSFLWINILTDIAYLLTGIENGVATWEIKYPDSIQDNGQIYVIGAAELGSIQVIPGVTVDIPPGVIVSDPALGEYAITNIRLDSNKKVKITFDEDPQ